MGKSDSSWFFICSHYNKGLFRYKSLIDTKFIGIIGKNSLFVWSYIVSPRLFINSKTKIVTRHYLCQVIKINIIIEDHWVPLNEKPWEGCTLLTWSIYPESHLQGNVIATSSEEHSIMKERKSESEREKNFQKYQS